MAKTPKIITARSLGLAFQNLFGQLGAESNVTGHYSAGGRAKTWQEGVAKAKEFHAYHKGKGWGGAGYHYLIADDGGLICLRPTVLKGTHVGGHNTSNIGVNCPGTTGDKPTAQQKVTYQWLLANAHTAAMPKAHRTDRDLRQAKLSVHRDWSGHETNGCAGLFSPMFRAGLRRDVPEEFEEKDLPTGAGEYPESATRGTTEADYRHVSPEEAEAAKNIDEADEELPDADPEFDEVLEEEMATTK